LVTGFPASVMGSERFAMVGIHSSTKAPLSLAQISDQAFLALDEAGELVPEVVVRPAIPILFFGDIEQYRRSPLRIVTVGLNPSLAEFPTTGPLERFPAATQLKGLETAVDHDNYVRALSSYFREAPYGSWFGTFEGLLNGMDASFYDGSPNTALHTDICSPVATNPTWSKLPEPARAALVKPGRALWNGLMELLEPHAVLISVARRYLDTLDFASESEWAELDRVERRDPYIVRHRRLSLGGNVTTTAIFGKAAQKPFSLISSADKLRIGAAVKELLDAR
jgi:hypothetical protein